MPDGARAAAPSSPSSPILVTGGAGFVGRWLLPALEQRFPGRPIVLGTRMGEKPPAGAARTAILDITERDAVDEAVRAIAPGMVVHLAAVSAVQQARADPRLAYRVNVEGTMNLAEAVLRHAPAARFLFVSTAEVYGGTFRRAAKPLAEDAALDPVNPYAASKAAADLFIGQMAHGGLKAIRARPFNHTGPGQSDDFALPAFASQIARIERGLQPPVLRVGNLDAERDFLDVRDVTRAYADLLAWDAAAPGEVLNLASGHRRRLGDVLEDLLRRARVAVRIEPDPARLRPNDTPLAIGDASKAARCLGWEPRIPWTTTLDDVLADWRGRIPPA